VIILSGVLVVVAIALLIAGIVAGNSGTEVVGLDGLNLIYVSIAVSIVSALFLAIGVFVRRKELFGSPTTGATGPVARTAKHGKAKTKAGEGATTRPASGENATAASGGIPVQTAGGHASGTDIDTAELAAMAPSAADVPATAVVYVVPGRRRYHIDSCRQLAGREKEELTFEEAREEGFSPCTACLPDTALAARAAAGDLVTTDVTTDEPDTAPEAETETLAPAAGSADERGAVGRGQPTTADDLNYVTPVQRRALEDLTEDDEQASATEPFDRLPGAGTGGAAARGPAGGEASAEAGTAGRPAPGEPGFTGADDADDADSADDDPAGDAAPDVPQQATRPVAAADAARSGAASAAGEPAADVPDDGGPLVRILSGTKRYHRPNCALIEDIGDDADDLESLSRAEAQARGCTPCLVCQPDKQPATRD
jgi:methylphosphotriester-DNA--protein-cysteine methyltransferase